MEESHCSKPSHAGKIKEKERKNTIKLEDAEHAYAWFEKGRFFMHPTLFLCTSKLFFFPILPS